MVASSIMPVTLADPHDSRYTRERAHQIRGTRPSARLPAALDGVRRTVGRATLASRLMKIPVFVSCPTSLSAKQQKARALVLDRLDRLGLEPRAIGRSDYPTMSPLREVLVLARHCSGGVILGFEQYRGLSGVSKPGSSDESVEDASRPFPTPWNQLEAGILFGQRLPLLIFRENGIQGGVFDPGVTDVFVHPMPSASGRSAATDALDSVFLKWQAEVRHHYYEA